MELKTFAEDDFDSKKWINKAWSSSGNQEKEVFVTNTVSRLQLYMKQLTNSLDETSTQIVTSIPRILQDASALQLEGAMLQQKLLLLEQMVRDVEEQTGSSIESLQRIDQLKSRLENAASALREADKWAALACGLEDTLEAGVPTGDQDVAALAERVAAMTTSLEVLSEAPDYESKRLQLETLYNRLEAAVTPPLIDALTQMDAVRTARYVSLFASMSRHVSACRCWRRAAAARLAAAWRRTDARRVGDLTGLLAAECSDQIDWLTNVLKTETPLGELIRLYTDLLLSLEPSPTKVVSASLKLCSSPEEGMNHLLDLRTDIDDFIACIKNVIEAPRQNKETLLPATIREFGRAAYAPLRELLPRYTELLQQQLMARLDDPLLKQDDLLELSRALLSVAERCEGWMTAAYTRAEKIAGVAAYPYYMPAVDNFITGLSNMLASHSRSVEAQLLSGAAQRAGVLSAAFPAAVALEAAAGALLKALASTPKGEEIEPSEGHPLSELPTFLLEGEARPRLAERRAGAWPSAAALARTRDQLKALARAIEDHTQIAVRGHPLNDLPTFLLEGEARPRLAERRAGAWPSAAALARTRDQLRALARAIARNPVDVQLDKIPQLSVWSNNDALSTDLPDFALSPQEYITEIGQYLMTLPQHLEMHLSEKQAPWQFLSEVCTHTCEVYAEKILNIRNMDALGTKRCLTDIVYLSSVVEDLGSSITPSLKNLEKSLRAATPAQAE